MTDLHISEIEQKIAKRINDLAEEIDNAQPTTANKEELQHLIKLISERKEYKELLGGMIASRINQLPWT